MLSQYLQPRPDATQEEIEAGLLIGLREDHYVWQEQSYWASLQDERTTEYISGGQPDRTGETFVPTGMDPEARRRDLATPLDELAQQAAEARATRIQTVAEADRLTKNALQGDSQDRPDTGEGRQTVQAGTTPATRNAGAQSNRDGGDEPKRTERGQEPAPSRIRTDSDSKKPGTPNPPLTELQALLRRHQGETSPATGTTPNGSRPARSDNRSPAGAEKRESRVHQPREPAPAPEPATGYAARSERSARQQPER